MVHGQEKASFLRNMGVDSVIDAAALKQPLSKAVKAAAPKGTCTEGQVNTTWLIWVRT